MVIVQVFGLSTGGFIWVLFLGTFMGHCRYSSLGSHDVVGCAING